MLEEEEMRCIVMRSVEYRVEYGARPKSGIEVKIQE